MSELEQQAVADQVRTMREAAREMEAVAWPKSGSAHNVFALYWQAAKLRANADRLEQRAQEAVNASL